MPTKTTLLILSSARQGRENKKERLMGQGKDRERSLINYCLGQNRIDLGKLLYYQSNQSKIMRNKTKSSNHLPPIPPFFMGSTSLLIFSTSSPQWCRGTGDGSCSQFITCCFCCSFLLRRRTPHTLPLLQCGVPPTRDSPPQVPPT